MNQASMNSAFDDDDFIFSNAPWFILGMNGSLSAVSSMLIISIILRLFPESRTSAYHIIMFFMSFWDIIASVAMALSTIPMPYDVHEIYPFAGKALGNVGTCEAQGFLIGMATMLILCSNTILNIYYVCTLRYGMTEEKFKRRILPIYLVLATAISTIMPTFAIRTEYFNPSPINYYCTYNAYPYGCNVLIGNGESGEALEGTECIRGKIFLSTLMTNQYVGFVLVVGTFLVLVLSLMLVVATVFDAELGIRRSRRTQRTPGTDDGARSRANLQEREFMRTRTVLFQALMYISAFLFTWVWVIILTAKVRQYSIKRPSNTMAFLMVFFPPLQGFFNALIFVYQKAHILRQANSRLSYFEALKQVIVSPSTVPHALVSSIEIVEEDARVLRPSRVHRSVTRSERQRMVLNSGLRRYGHENNATPPASVSSGVSSSSLDVSSAISLRRLVIDDEEIVGEARAQRTSINSLDLSTGDPLSAFSVDSSFNSNISANNSDSTEIRRTNKTRVRRNSSDSLGLSNDNPLSAFSIGSLHSDASMNSVISSERRYTGEAKVQDDSSDGLSNEDHVFSSAMGNINSNESVNSTTSNAT